MNTTQDGIEPISTTLQIVFYLKHKELLQTLIFHTLLHQAKQLHVEGVTTSISSPFNKILGCRKFWESKNLLHCVTIQHELKPQN